MFFAYILYSPSKDSFYIGSSGDLFDRLRRHNGGQSLATKNGCPWILAYFEVFESRALAVQRELYFKSKKSKIFLRKLCFPYLSI